MIHFDRVTKQYGSRTVLDNITLQVEGGELVTLIGPSGAGKSTLLHTLIGMTPVTRGAITVDGYEITAFTPDALQEYRRKIGVVFQDYRLLPHKTVYENVAFALEVCGWKESDIRPRVMEVLEKVGMSEHEGKLPEQLAGGELQRTAIARALVHHPRLLIADEPTGNLDYLNAQGILDLLLAINAEGVTVLMATHNRELVDQIQRRVVAINHGRIVSDKETSGYELEWVVASSETLADALGESLGELVGELEITEIS